MQFESDIAEEANDDMSEDDAVVEELVGSDAPAEDVEPAADEVAPVPVSETVAEVVSEAASVDGPTVDSLEDRLRDLQGAMDKIQSGDLDAAEQAIEALEHQMETTRD